MRLRFVAVSALLSLTLQAQTFKGHRIGESTTEFLKLEPSLQAKVTDCQATAPRPLTSEEIIKRYGRKRYEQYEKQEAERRKQGQSSEVMDQDMDVYGDKCAALLDALVKGSGSICGNGYNPGNSYAESLLNRPVLDPRGHPLPHVEISDGRGFNFKNGTLSALSLDVAADFGSVRDDVTSRLGIAPKEASVPYQNAFGARWQNRIDMWDSDELRVELTEDNNPAKTSSPHLWVRSRTVYKDAIEKEKVQASPLD